MSHRLNRANDYLTREDEQKMMIHQLNRVVEYLECLPLTIINMDNIEADDVIGYCSKHIFKKKVMKNLLKINPFLKIQNNLLL